MKFATLVALVVGLVQAALATTCQDYITAVPVTANISTVDPTTGARTYQVINETYNISARLCVPDFSPSAQANTVQFLVHGITYDKTYWDFPVTPFINSYTNYANLLGYATFTIDRLGNGLSSHPDDVNEIQGATHIQIVHSLIQKLRSGFYSKTFSKVVLIGHSYGSCITNGLVAVFPNDADAIVLTGYSHQIFVDQSEFADIGPANAVDPTRFGSLPDGYLTITTAAARTALFYHAPFFSTDVSTRDFQTEQTVTSAEINDLVFPGGPLLVSAPAFTGHVHYVNGDFDGLFCGEPTFTQCSSAGNTALSGEHAYFPNAQFSFTIIPFTGHDVNLHYTAPATFADILTWNLLLGF